MKILYKVLSNVHRCARSYGRTMTEEAIQITIEHFDIASIEKKHIEWSAVMAEYMVFDLERMV